VRQHYGDSHGLRLLRLGWEQFADLTPLWLRLISPSLPAAGPTKSRAAAPPAATSDKPDDEKQHDGADRRVDDPTDGSHTKLDTKARHQPVTNECADNPDYYVAEEAIARPPGRFDQPIIQQQVQQIIRKVL
jgi:hypothetical protein